MTRDTRGQGDFLNHARRFAGPRSDPTTPRDTAYERSHSHWMRAHRLLGVAASVYALLALWGLAQGEQLAYRADLDLTFWSLVALLALAPSVLFVLLALAVRPLGLALLGQHLIMLALYALIGVMTLGLWAVVFVPL